MMSDEAPYLQIDSWSGPLDVLVERARARALDLRQMPLLDLVEQLSRSVDTGLRERPLVQSAQWLVLAATLLQLRSVLMLGNAEPHSRSAMAQVEELRHRALRRQALAQAVSAFSRRPRLGEQVFGREREEVCCEVRLLQTDLLDACLALLRRRLKLQPRRPALPQPFSCFTVSQALAWWRQQLSKEKRPFYRLGEGLPKEDETAKAHASASLQRNATKAAHFLAVLELGKQGTVALAQGRPFGEVAIMRPEQATVPTDG